MIGILWNCRGVSKKGMRIDIRNLINEVTAVFIGFHETMRKNYNDKFFRLVDPNKVFAWHWLPSNGRSGGILCGIRKENFDIDKVTEHEFAIEVEAVDKKCHNRLRLVTIYGPAQVEKKEKFLTDLSTICAKGDLPLIVGGDFNILRFSDEKNKSFCANRYSEMFNWIINTYGLREIALVGGKFTWSNNHDLPTLEKLDRVLMNDKWEGLFPLTTLRKRPRLMSDHNPLLLCTGQDQKKKAKKFQL
jgi:hypothetical protein